MDSKPGGRTKVWIGIAIVLLIVIVAFFARPIAGSGGGPDRQAAQSNPAAPAQPAGQP